MADNVQLSAGTADGAVFATDDATGVHFPYMKMVFGPDNTQTLVSTSNPLPVDLRTDNLSGNLDVNIAASAATVTVQGTVTADAGIGTFETSDLATQVDDAAFAPGTSRIMMFGAEFDDNTPDSVDEGDGGAVRMSANRNLYTTIRDAAGNERGANVNASNQLLVSVGNTPTVDTELPTAATLSADDVAAPTAPAVGSFGFVFDGTNWDRMRGTSADGVLVNLGANNDVTVTGSVTANAGTNLNTSALALESGGNLATLAGAVSGSEMQVDIVSGSVDTELPAAAALSDAFANPTAPAVGAFLMGFDGTDWERIRVTNTGQAHVAVQNTVTVTGTITVGTLPNEGQQSMANSISVAIASDQSNVPVSQATASNLNAQVVGVAAHDAAVSGNPVAMAARANLDEPATAVADGDATHLWADRFGRLVTVNGHADPQQPVQFPLTASGETAVTEIGAPGASTSNCICKGSFHNSGASPITVQLKDGTGGTVVWEAELAADGGGSIFDFGDRGWQMTANTGLYANLSGSGTVSLNVTQWYIAATQT